MALFISCYALNCYVHIDGENSLRIIKNRQAFSHSFKRGPQSSIKFLLAIYEDTYRTLQVYLVFA